jgi:hypothetical protein
MKDITAKAGTLDRWTKVVVAIAVAFALVASVTVRCHADETTAAPPCPILLPKKHHKPKALPAPVCPEYSPVPNLLSPWPDISTMELVPYDVPIEIPGDTETDTIYVPYPDSSGYIGFVGGVGASSVPSVAVITTSHDWYSHGPQLRAPQPKFKAAEISGQGIAGWLTLLFGTLAIITGARMRK